MILVCRNSGRFLVCSSRQGREGGRELWSARLASWTAECCLDTTSGGKLKKRETGFDHFGCFGSNITPMAQETLLHVPGMQCCTCTEVSSFHHSSLLVDCLLHLIDSPTHTAMRDRALAGHLTIRPTTIKTLTLTYLESSSLDS